jgi:putative component of membrane protein insertase Oxa1/YidC/SpoIIIJ protein YidD
MLLELPEEKQKGIHSEKSKQTIEADCRFSGEISDYLYTALKGWGIWVSNRLPGK